MWPSDAFRGELPESFEVREDHEFLELRCRRCDWRCVFSVAGARSEEIARTAGRHRCPESEEVGA